MKKLAIAALLLCTLGLATMYVFSETNATFLKKHEMEEETAYVQFYKAVEFGDVGECFKENGPTCDKIVNDAIAAMSKKDKKAFIEAVTKQDHQLGDWIHKFVK